MNDSDGTPIPTEDPPGAIAWSVIAIGWIVVVVGVIGALTDDGLRGTFPWVVWFFGAALVHDALVLPLVIGVGWALGRLLPAEWLTPLRTATIIGAVLTLTIWPIARRYGARADNPSILPLPVARNLVLVLAAILFVALVVGAVNSRRGASRPDHGTDGAAR